MAAFTCPQCHVELRSAKLPEAGKKVRCPKCSHTFTPSAHGIKPPARPRPAPLPQRELADSDNKSLARWLALTAIAAVLMVGLGVGVMLAWPWGTPAPEPTAPPPIASVKPPVPEPTPPVVPVTPAPPKATTPEIKEQDKEPKVGDEQEREKRRTEFTRLMIKAARDLDGGRLDDAVASYKQGLQLFPSDADAQQGLQQAQAKLDAQAKTRQDGERENVAVWLKQGEDALMKKEPAAAVEIFKLVLQKQPGEATALKGLATAQGILAQDGRQKARQADFAKHMAAGQAALQAGRYPDAIASFISAQVALPGNPQAGALLLQAEQKMAGLQKDEQRQKDFDKLMAQAGNAATARKLDEAEQFYRQALKLFPQNKQAQQALAELQRGTQQNRKEFTDLMERGQQALQNGQYVDAISWLREAVRLEPENKTALKILRDAEQSVERLSAYNEAMRRGQGAMALKRYADAVLAYGEALRNVPNDLLASQGLQQAQVRLQQELQRQQEFDLKVKQGQAALSRFDYARAASLLGEAEELIRFHPNLPAIKSQRRFAGAMVKGKEAMIAKNYQEATTQFQNAMQENPQDSSARQAYIQARALSGIGTPPPVNPKDKKDNKKTDKKG